MSQAGSKQRHIGYDPVLIEEKITSPGIPVKNGVVALDRGWAWVVLLSYCVITTLVPLVGAFFGLLFGHLVQSLELNSTTVAWIFNLQQLSWNLAGLLGGPLCLEFGWRAIAMTSSAVATVSLIITTFVETLTALYLNALVFGLCSGLAFCVGQMMLPQYFDKRLGLAMSLSTGAVGLGQFIIPVYITFLHENFGKVWASRIFAATLGNTIAASMFFHPLEGHSREKCGMKQASQQFPRKSHGKAVHHFLKSINKAFQSLSELDIMVVSLCCATYVLCYYNFLVMLPFTIVSKGFSWEAASYCIGVGGFSNILGRLLVGPLTDKLKLLRTPLFIFGHFLIASSILALTCSSSIFYITASIVLHGFGTGIAISLHTLVLMELRGKENLGRVFGAFSIVTMCLFVCLGPLLGFVRDSSDSYVLTNQILSGLVFCDAITLVIMRIFWSKKHIIDSR